jgi:hypothetical protein
MLLLLSTRSRSIFYVIRDLVGHNNKPSILSALQPWVSLGLLTTILHCSLSSEADCWVSEQIIFLRCGVVSPTPNPQPGGPGYPFSSGSSPLTCLAWEALPVAYATASIALGFIWPRKLLHYVKVRISIPTALLNVYFTLLRKAINLKMAHN